MDGALDETDIRKTVNIESLVNKYKCPTRVVSCHPPRLHPPCLFNLQT